MIETGVGAEGLYAACEMLKKNTTIRRFDLGGLGYLHNGQKEIIIDSFGFLVNDIGDQGVETVCEMLKVNTVLEALYLGCEEE